MIVGKLKKLGQIKVSDWFITIPTVIIGTVLIVIVLYQDRVIYHRSLIESFFSLTKYFPLAFAAMYLWLKAVVYDITRIRRNISMPPGFVYLIYALQWLTIWMSDDLLYNGASAHFPPSPLRIFWLFDHPYLFWFIINSIVEITFIITKPFIDTESFEIRLLTESVLSSLTFYLIGVISLFL